MKTRLLFPLFLIICYFGNSQTTDVPDDAFENYLETHNASGILVTLGDPTSMGDGIAGNDLVTTANISSVTTLNVINLGITDLTGIADFAALTVLNCMDNDLVSLDVSSNTNLSTLVCQDNQINSLNLGTIPQLTQLFCGNNQLTSIDLTPFTNLAWLEINDNTGLTNLNVSGNSILQRIDASNCPIGSIDFTANPFQWFVRYIYLNNCNLTELDVSTLTDLTELEVSNNNISQLDLSSNTTQFRRLICSNNNLTILNVKNGVNNLITDANFNALNNNLTCITVDDENYSTTNWTNIDAGVSFSTDCSLGLENNSLGAIRVYPNPVKNLIYIQSPSESKYQLFDLIGREISQGNLNVGTNKISTSKISNSMFLIQIENEFGQVTKRIIKN